MNHKRSAGRARGAAIVAMAFTTATAVLAIFAPPASASQPTAILQPSQDQLYSTAFWGVTSFCAHNASSTAGRMLVASWGGAGGGPTVDVPANSTRCHSGWYWAVPARIVNNGSAPLSVTVTP